MKSVFNYVKMIVLDLIKAIAATILMTIVTFVSMVLFTIQMIELLISGSDVDLSSEFSKTKALLAIDWRMVRDGWKFGASQLSEEYISEMTKTLEDTYYDF